MNKTSNAPGIVANKKKMPVSTVMHLNDTAVPGASVYFTLMEHVMNIKVIIIIIIFVVLYILCRRPADHRSVGGRFYVSPTIDPYKEPLSMGGGTLTYDSNSLDGISLGIGSSYSHTSHAMNQHSVAPSSPGMWPDDPRLTYNGAAGSYLPLIVCRSSSVSGHDDISVQLCKFNVWFIFLWLCVCRPSRK